MPSLTLTTIFKMPLRESLHLCCLSPLQSEICPPLPVDTHLMSCMFPYENLVVGVPEANAPIPGGADTDVTLPCMLTERKA